MRVLHLTTEFPPVIFGGLGTAVGGLVHASADAGVDVGVLLVGSSVSGYGPTADHRSGSSEAAPAVTVRAGVTLFPVAWDGAAAAAAQVCRWWRPDVVHLHVFWLWDIARHLQADLGLPLVYTVHSLDVAEYQLGNGPSECLERWRVQQDVLDHADVIHAPSVAEAELVAYYQPQAAGRLRVAGHGIEDPYGRPRYAPQGADPPVVLFVGRFVERKGINDLLAAIPAILARAPAARFVLGGGHRGVNARADGGPVLTGPLRAFRDQVAFTGWLSPEATAAWYARADILVVPSWYEPFGMVILEGMLEGLAIAATNVGGPGEILHHEHTGLLFPPRDVDALADSVTRLLLDGGLRHRLGTAAALEVRERWLWPQVMRSVRVIYDEAAADSRLPAVA